MRSSMKRQGQQGFTLVEGLIAMTILAMAGAFYFGTQRVVQREFTFLTDGMRARQVAQQNLNEISRALGSLTDVAPDAGGDPYQIIIFQDFNYPRTPLDLEDDTEGLMVYDPDANVVQISDTVDYPYFRTIAKDVEDFEVDVNDSLIVLTMDIRPTPHSGITTLRTAFALRNLPR